MKALSILFLSLLSTTIMEKNGSGDMHISAEKLIQEIIEKTGSDPVPNTVDIIKEGDPKTPVTGIVTCMFATMEVLKRAVDLNSNLIITHEPLYYNHLDQTEQFEQDPVFLAKKKYINDHNLVVWRFHDYIHRIQPDGIFSGMVEKLGWKDYVVENDLSKYSFPEMSLSELLSNLKETFPENAFYVVGEPTMRLSNVRLAPGAPGSITHINLLRKEDVDVVIAGEVSQWETYEYVRDAVEQGRNKAIVFIGHISSEESGMKYSADWLSRILPETPVKFVECGSSYWSY